MIVSNLNEDVMVSFCDVLLPASPVIFLGNVILTVILWVHVGEVNSMTIATSWATLTFGLGGRWSNTPLFDDGVI